MVQGQVYSNGVGAGGADTLIFLFNFFNVYHFFYLEIALPFANCVMHLKKNYFFLSP